MLLINRYLFRSFLLLASIGFSSFANAQEYNDAKVLFVGNSYTYFWNLPQTVSAMAQSQNLMITTRQSTAGGASLKQHWDGEKDLKSKEIIAQGNWDVVILQNHSMSAINNKDDFYEFGKKFINLTKQSGAEPILYMTWAREYNPLMQNEITAGYRKLAQDNAIRLIPVGLIWEQVRNLRPDLQLFDPDGSHPSSIGTYLTACAFYSVLTGKSATDLPNRLTYKDKDGEKLYLSIVSPTDADFLQEVVDLVLKEQRN